MSTDFFTAVKNRRSVYDISDEVIVPKGEIISITEDALKHTPSAFNSQSTRVVLLFEDEHKKMWNIVLEILKNIVPKDKFKDTETRILSFAKGYGTLLYFEDETVIEQLQNQYPLYKDNFPKWAMQANAMLQLVVWTALEDLGLGVTLQHYNPLMDDAIKKEWNISKDWTLIGQMPFGKPLSAPDEKQFMPIKDRLIVVE